MDSNQNPYTFNFCLMNDALHSASLLCRHSLRLVLLFGLLLLAHAGHAQQPLYALAPTPSTAEGPATTYPTPIRVSLPAAMAAELLEASNSQQKQLTTLGKMGVVLSQRVAESEYYTLQRLARAEATLAQQRALTATLVQRLQALEKGSNK